MGNSCLTTLKPLLHARVHGWADGGGSAPAEATYGSREHPPVLQNEISPSPQASLAEVRESKPQRLPYGIISVIPTSFACSVKAVLCGAAPRAAWRREGVKTDGTK